jgi:AbrB family looped-hinge helix DNA binding protein
MRATIDKAGRLVIPAQIREQVGLVPGSEVEVFVDDLSIRLVRRTPAPELVREGNRWVVRPTVTEQDLPEVDLAGIIDEERNRWPL